MNTGDEIKLESIDCGNDLVNSEVCRVCLSESTKMFNLFGCSLSETFSAVSGLHVSPTDGLPQQLCMMCNALLQKIASFRNRCHETHRMLVDNFLLNNVPMSDMALNYEQLKTVHLTISEIVSIDCPPNTETESRNNPLDVDECEIKTEANNFNQADDYDIIESLVIDDTDLPNLVITDSDIPETDILNSETKEKNNTDTKPKSTQTRKRKNVKQTEKKTTKKRKTEEFDEEIVKISEKLKEHLYSLFDKEGQKIEKTDDKNTEMSGNKEEITEKPKKSNNRKSEKNDDEKEEKKTEKPGKPKRKKRPRNCKFEEDFVDFAKEYNVEVMFLTREQMLEDLQAKKELESFKSMRYQCTTCYTGFVRESSFKKHMNTHALSAGSHVCDVCDTRFPTRYQMLNHFRRHKFKFICKTCNYVSKSSNTAKVHFRWHQGIKYDCDHCDKKFSVRSSYMNHVREQHSPAACAACGLRLRGTCALDKHVAAEHAQIYECNHCGTRFKNKDAILRHNEIIAGSVSDPYLRPCPECGENFNTLDHLNTHLEKDHNKLHRCDICNTTYSTDRYLGIHWANAHASRKRAPRREQGTQGNFMCEVCAKSYPSKSILRYHQRLHTGERPYQCRMCPKRFRTTCNLQVHMNTHTGARPFKCALCPETFKSYSQKYKHKLLVHTLERPHKCQLCEKAYVVTSDLKMHVRTTHLKEPWPVRARPRKRPNKTEK